MRSRQSYNNMAKKKQNKEDRVKQRPESNAATATQKKTKMMLAISLTVMLILAATIIGLLTKQFQPPQQTESQAKIAAVPTEIKSEKEASVVQQDASSILSDVQDTLKNIDTSLPDV